VVRLVQLIEAHVIDAQALALFLLEASAARTAAERCGSCTKKVSSGLCITAPGDLVDDFHHVESLDLLF
jgi:hypothetical protein